MTARRNDWVRTPASVPSFVLRLVFIGFVAAAALLLVPVMGWQIAAVAAAAFGVIVPQSYSAWIAPICIAVGMLMSEPSIWRAMAAVFVAHICHVMASLLLAIPAGSRVFLAALTPTALRVLVVQAVAQPLTLGVMLLSGAVEDSGSTAFAAGLAPIVGALGLAAFAIAFLRHLKRTDDAS